jgi:hypothetical protein
MIVFHQNAKGHKKGERIVVGDTPPNKLGESAKRFQAYRVAELEVAQGDRLRITANGSTKDGKHRLNNGATYHVAGFTKSGDVKLSNGWIVDRQFGFLNHGVVVNSHASQGRSVHRVILAESSLSLPAASREQFYVSVSRGKKGGVVIYTDDKQALRDAIIRSDDRIAATELVKDRKEQRTTMLRRLAAKARIMAGRQRGRKRERDLELTYEQQ